MNVQYRGDDGIVLIVGGDSDIGRSLVNAFALKGANVWQTTRHYDRVSKHCLYLDLSEDVSRWELPRKKVSVAVICASVTLQEQCRIDPVATRQVNVINTVKLIKNLVSCGSFVVFLSTNAVFDGEKPLAKSSDALNPQTEYGKQKAAVERQLLSLGGSIAVVRLGKVIVPDMDLFQGWVRDLERGREIYPFSDMVFSPISLQVAVACICMVVMDELLGVSQVTAPVDISYAEAAYDIAKRIGADETLVKPTSCKNSNSIHFVPRYTALECNLLCQDLEGVGLDSLLSLNCLDCS